MVASSSCFAQLLSLVNRNDFERLTKKHRGERHSKGFGCWDQLVAMLFCQLGGAHTLREISGGLATALGKLSHLGLTDAPKRTTLSYANKVRPWQLYEELFYHLLEDCRRFAQQQQRKFGFKNPLRSLDSTTIDLCLSAFEWAKFRRKKGAVKLHLLLDHQGCLPCWALVSDGKMHDIRAAKELSLAPGTIVAMDRAYVDYALLQHWTEEGVLFVTRTKKNMACEVTDEDYSSHDGIFRDEWVELTGATSRRKHPGKLRRILVWDDEKERAIELLTNIKHLAASTIADIYKERWQIELFFKALKQNLKVKTFVGTSVNAVKIQLWTALIAMLLLKYLKLKSTWNWSLSNLAAMLRMNLLTYRDLWAWLDDPFKVSVNEPPPVIQRRLFA